MASTYTQTLPQVDVHWSQMGFDIKVEKELHRKTSRVRVTSPQQATALDMPRSCRVQSLPDTSPCVIERGVPIPDYHPTGRKKGNHKVSKYPFMDLKVGDCFFVPCPPHRTVRSLVCNMGGNIRTMSLRYPGYEWVQRSYDNLGIRVWRVA